MRRHFHQPIETQLRSFFLSRAEREPTPLRWFISWRIRILLMGRQLTAYLWYRRILAGAAHMLAVCCIPVFTLVLVMNNSAAWPPDHRSHAPTEHA